MMNNDEMNELHKLLKHIKETNIIFPDMNQKGEYHVDSLTSSHKFIVNISRSSRIRPKKCTYQIRAEDNSVMFRVDIDGPAHPNPDGSNVPCPHIHIYDYKDGSYLENWAFPLGDRLPTNPDDLVQVFLDFLVFNNVQNSPIIISRMEF